MAVKVSGTEVGGKHELEIPFEPVRALLAKYRDRDPEKTALYDLDQDALITFGQLHDAANHIARLLIDMGVGKGDRVAVLSDERLEKLILWMGIWRAGAVIMPLNVEMNIAYVAEILRSLAPKLTLWHEDMDVDRMTEGVGGEIMKFTRWVPDAAGDAGADEFFARAAAVPDGPEPDVEDYAADDVGSIYCTSAPPTSPSCSSAAIWAIGRSGSPPST